MTGIPVYVSDLLPFEREVRDENGEPTGETELVSCIQLEGKVYMSQEAWDIFERYHEDG